MLFGIQKPSVNFLMQRMMIKSHLEIKLPKIKQSTFLAAVYPVNTSEELKDILHDRRVQLRKASHHCYAVRYNSMQEDCSDDGEPHGTAGKRILHELRSMNLVNTFLVVSRIYGGVKFGTGLLSRTYTAAAKDVLGQATLVPYVDTVQRCILVPFQLIDRVQRICNEAKLSSKTTIGREKGVVVSIEMPKEQEDDVLRMLQAVCHNQLEFL